MNGLLITNKYIMTDKFKLLRDRFVDEASKLSIKLDSMNNFDAYTLLDKKMQYDFIIFYDKDIKLAKQLEVRGYVLYNNSDAIKKCDDKFLTYMALKGIVKQPKTISAPFLYYGDLSNDNDFINHCEIEFSYPMIVKECSGSFGFQVYKIDKRDELISCIEKMGNKPFIVQEFIATSFGKDIRIQVIGDNVVCAMLRVNNHGDFRANVTNGADVYPYEPSKEQEEIALKTAKKLNLDFAGIDILFGDNDEPILCEVNSNAHLENLGKISNVNLYRKILEYAINKTKQA